MNWWENEHGLVVGTDVDAWMEQNRRDDRTARALLERQTRRMKGDDGRQVQQFEEWDNGLAHTSCVRLWTLSRSTEAFPLAIVTREGWNVYCECPECGLGQSYRLGEVFSREWWHGARRAEWYTTYHPPVEDEIGLGVSPMDPMEFLLRW